MTATDPHRPGHRAGFFVALLFPLFKELPEAGTGTTDASQPNPNKPPPDTKPADLAPAPLSVRHPSLVNPSRFWLPRFGLPVVALVGCRPPTCRASASQLSRFQPPAKSPKPAGSNRFGIKVSPL
jgi:hypothetical protein